jgi:hypothetical protein
LQEVWPAQLKIAKNSPHRKLLPRGTRRAKSLFKTVAAASASPLCQTIASVMLRSMNRRSRFSGLMRLTPIDLIAG